MRRFLLLLPFIPSLAFSTTYTSSGNGNWNSAGTWGGAGVPGNGDKVIISNGNTVTVSDDRIVGISTNSSPSINLSGSGILSITSTGRLHVRGDTRFDGSGSAPGTIQLQVAGDGVWEFDSCTSTPAATTHYTYSASGAFVFSSLSFVGTPGHYAVIRSSANCGTGRFTANSSSTQSLLLAYTYVNRIGDATHGSFDWDDRDNAMFYNVTHSSFDTVGPITNTGCCGVGASIFIHDSNVHTNTSATVFSSWLNFSPLTPVKEIKNNVFDTVMADTYFFASSFTISGNYFGGVSNITQSNGGDPAIQYVNNFQRFDGSPINGSGDVSDTYYFADVDVSNPHVLFGCNNISGIVWGLGGEERGPPYNDSGEFYFLNDALVITTCPISSSIFLPTAAGFQGLEIGSLVPSYPHLVAKVQHNTYFGGWDSGAAFHGAINEGEGGNSASNNIASFSGNILWNPELMNYTANFYKMHDISNSGSPNIYCTPSGCDYNGGYNFTAIDDANPQYTNQANGYASKFTSTPGTHDITGDPQFVDYHRSVELLDSKYFGRSPAAWSGGASYSVGDFVVSSSTSIYWNDPVNYRYINAGSCGNSNPQPGKGANWRNCWEWASLYDLRQNVATDTRYTDQSIGMANEPIIQLLLRWVRAGYSSQKTTYGAASFDGGDIGSMPILFAAPTSDPNPPASISATLSGNVQIRGGAILR